MCCNYVKDDFMETTIQLKDFVDWIFKVAKENPERPIKMHQNHSTDDCGCLMVQYSREVLGKNDDRIACGFSIINIFHNDNNTHVYTMKKKDGTRALIPIWFFNAENFKMAAQIASSVEV